MSKKNILIATLFSAAVICAGTIIVFQFINRQPIGPSPSTPSSAEEKTTTDAAELQKQAETVIITDPETASDKYQEASDIYKELGNTDKAAENAANAAAADAGIQNSEPPTAPPPGSATPR